LYGLIKAGTTPTVKVGGNVWQPVANLASASASAHVYTLDRGEAFVQFGDGRHGAIPPTGQPVTVSYAFHHDGFVAMYNAMKDVARQIGTDIQICSIWSPFSLSENLAQSGQPSFPAAMAARGLADHYDCMAMHPYNGFQAAFGDAWASPADAHNETMLGESE